MKRYLIFSYSEYYPSGGLDDVRASFDILEEAKSAIENEIFFISSYACYIFDRIEGKTVYNLYEE